MIKHWHKSCGKTAKDWLTFCERSKNYFRTCSHRNWHASFRQILPMTASKFLEIHEYSCGIFPCPPQNLLENLRTLPMRTSSKNKLREQTLKKTFEKISAYGKTRCSARTSHRVYEKLEDAGSLWASVKGFSVGWNFYFKRFLFFNTNS